MVTTRTLRTWLRDGPAGVERTCAHLTAHPGDTHELVSALSCDDVGVESGAAAALVAVAHASPRLLAPFAGRLFRVAGGSDRKVVRLGLAEALPLLDLGSRQAGRLAFVLESWLDDPDADIKRAAMTALVALVPQRPALAPRVRQEIERRAAAGSPTAARHGLALLRRLREF